MSKFYQQSQQSQQTSSSKRPKTQVTRDNLLENSLESSKAKDKDGSPDNYLRMYTTMPFNMQKQMKIPQHRSTQKANQSGSKPYQIQAPMQFSNQYQIKTTHFQKMNIHYMQMQKGNIGFPYLEKQSNFQNLKDRYSKVYTRSQSRSKLIGGSRDGVESNRSSKKELVRSQRSLGQTFQSNSKSSINRSKTSSQKQRYKEGNINGYARGMQEYLKVQNQQVDLKHQPQRIIPEKLKQAFTPSSNKSHTKMNPTISYRNNQGNKSLDDTSEISHNTMMVQQMYEEFKSGTAEISQFSDNVRSLERQKQLQIEDHNKMIESRVQMSPPRKYAETQNKNQASGTKLTINVQQNARNIKTQAKGRSGNEGGAKKRERDQNSFQKKMESTHWRIINSTQQKIDLSEDGGCSPQQFKQHYFDNLNQTSLNLFSKGSSNQTATEAMNSLALNQNNLQSDPTPLGRRQVQKSGQQKLAQVANANHTQIRVSRTANGFKIFNSTKGEFTPIRNREEPIPNIDNPYRNSFLDVSDNEKKDVNIIVGPGHQLSKFSADVSYDQQVDQQRMAKTGNQKQRVVSSNNNTNFMHKRKTRFSMMNTPQHLQAKSHSLHQKTAVPNSIETSGQQVVEEQENVAGGGHSNLAALSLQQDTPSNLKSRTQKVEKMNKYNPSSNKMNPGAGAMTNHNNSRSNPAPIFKNSKTKLMSIYKKGAEVPSNNSKQQHAQPEISRQLMFITPEESQNVKSPMSMAPPGQQGKGQAKQDKAASNGIMAGNIVYNNSYNNANNQEKVNPKKLLNPLPGEQQPHQNNNIARGPKGMSMGPQQNQNNNKDTLPKLKKEHITLPADRKNSMKLTQPSSHKDNNHHEGNVNSQIIEQTQPISVISIGPSGADQSTNLGGGPDGSVMAGAKPATAKAQTVHVQSKELSALKVAEEHQAFKVSAEKHQAAAGSIGHSTSQSKLQQNTQDSTKPSPQVPNLKSNLTTHVSREYEGGADGSNVPGTNNSSALEASGQRGKKNKNKSYQRTDLKQEMSPYIEEAQNVCNDQQYNGGQGRMKSTELVNSLSIDRLRQSKFVYRNFQENSISNNVANNNLIERANGNALKSGIDRINPSRMRTSALSPEQIPYTPDFTLNANIQYQNDPGFITGEQLQELQDDGLIDQFNNHPDPLRKSVLIASTNEQDQFFSNEYHEGHKQKMRQPAYIFSQSKRAFFQETMDELIELCNEKEAQYSETVSNLKQTLIDENSLIPGSQITESSFLPIEEPKTRLNGMPGRPRKPTERVICESISAYSIYIKNLSTVVDRVYFPECSNQDDRLNLQDNMIYLKLCLPRVLMTSFPSHSAMKEIQHNEGIRKMLVQIKHQFKEHRYIQTPVGISQLQRSYIEMQIYQMEYYNQSLIIKQQQQVYGVNRTDEAFFGMAKIPYRRDQDRQLIKVTNKKSNEMFQLLGARSPNNIAGAQQEQFLMQDRYAQMRQGSQQKVRIGSGSHIYGGYIGSENLSLVNGEYCHDIDGQQNQGNLQSYLKVRKQRQIQNIKNAYTFNTGQNMNVMHQSQLKQKIGAFQVKAQGNMHQTQGPFYQKDSLQADQGGHGGVIKKFKVNQKQVLLEPLTLKSVNQAQVKEPEQQEQQFDQRGRWLRKTRQSFNIPLEQFEEQEPANFAQRCITSNQDTAAVKSPFNQSDQHQRPSVISPQVSSQISPRIEVREVEIGSENFNSSDMELVQNTKLKDRKDKRDRSAAPPDDTSETHEHLVEPHIQQQKSRNDEVLKSRRNTSKSYHKLNKKSAKQSSDDVQQTQTFSNHILPSIQNEHRVNSQLSIGIHEQQKSNRRKIEVNNNGGESLQRSSIANQERGTNDHLPVLAASKTKMSQRSSNGRIQSADPNYDGIQFQAQSSKQIFTGSQSPEQAAYQKMQTDEVIGTPIMSASQVIRDQSRSERIFKKNQGTYSIYNQSHKELQNVMRSDRKFKESQDYQSQKKPHEDKSSQKSCSPLQKVSKKHKHHRLSQPPVTHGQDQPSIIFEVEQGPPQQHSQKQPANKKSSKHQIHGEQILFSGKQSNVSNNSNKQIVNTYNGKNKITGLEAYKSKIKKLIEIEKECIRDLNVYHGVDQSLFSPRRKGKNKMGSTKGNNQKGKGAQNSVYNMYQPIKPENRKSVGVKPIVPGKHLMNSLNFGGVASGHASPQRELEPADRKNILQTDRQHLTKI